MSPPLGSGSSQTQLSIASWDQRRKWKFSLPQVHTYSAMCSKDLVDTPMHNAMCVLVSGDVDPLPNDFRTNNLTTFVLTLFHVFNGWEQFIV